MLGLFQRFLTWAYRRLGRLYPAVYIIVELQSAWGITVGTLGIFAFYYESSTADFVRLLLLSLALAGITMVIAIVRALKYVRPLKRWIAGERDDPALASEAWSTAVGLPLYVIKRDMKLPVLLVALPVSVIAVIVLELNPLAFLPLVAGSLVAIGYAGILHYFALEAGMRPVLMDINRELPPRLATGRAALPLRIKLLAALPMINVITGLIAAALSGGSDGGGAQSLGIDVLIAVAVASTISLELTLMLSRSILRPIADLKQGVEAVREGHYDYVVPVTTGDELGELSAGFNQMVQGLAERERIREAFGTYLDKEVAEYILSEGFSAEGVELEVSILFCDVRDFTGFAAEAEATEVVSRLNNLFETLVPIVARHGGHVDKFVGDGLLAVFGAPEPHPDHADRAVRCAVEMAQRVNQADGELLPIGIGVNTGEVVAGSIGGAGRLNFSVIGDAVNVAARVEAATRELGNDVLVTAATRARLSETVEVEPCGVHRVKGREEPVELFAPPVPVRASKSAA
jgi:adenylate cyclase